MSCQMVKRSLTNADATSDLFVLKVTQGFITMC